MNPKLMWGNAHVLEFEIGIQLHLPTFRHTTLPDFVDFGRIACAGGVAQLWVTDNLRSRSQFVVLTALAGSAPLKLERR